MLLSSHDFFFRSLVQYLSYAILLAHASGDTFNGHMVTEGGIAVLFPSRLWFLPIQYFLDTGLVVSLLPSL